MLSGSKMIIFMAFIARLSTSSPVKRANNANGTPSSDDLKDVAFLSYAVTGDELLKSIAHEDSDVKKVIFNVTKAIAELSHYRDIVMLSGKAGANATTTMIVIDVVLSDLVEKSCEWLQAILGMTDGACTKELLQDLRMVLEAYNTTKTLSTSLSEMAPGFLNPCKWWFCNVVCPEEVSEEIAVYIAQHNVQQCPIHYIAYKEICPTICSP